MKKFLIAGNWKMNTTTSDAAELAKTIYDGIRNESLNIKILVCPPFTNLHPVYNIIKNSQISLGAQNCYFEAKGAFTGEISISMLKELNCSYIIIGHSERRNIFGETDELINKKAKAILENDLIPVICIGETLTERQNNDTFKVLDRQLNKVFNNIDKSFVEKIVIAYEPVWAIGTGIAAVPEQVQEAHSFIRNKLIDIFGEQASSIYILYGGSLNEENAISVLELDDVDGGLIGGASLKAKSFLSIISTAQSLAK
ncbi:MAG: triose-phosphate isomerase [FCB group bacterium]|jgi:triosephosphate isomerase